MRRPAKNIRRSDIAPARRNTSAPTMNDIRTAGTMLLFFLLTGISAGCMTVLRPNDYSKHYQDKAELIMIDSSKYTLASDWTVDSTQCIRGRGTYSKDDSTRTGKVAIPLSGISKLTVEDNITPIYFEVLVVSAVFLHYLH